MGVTSAINSPAARLIDHGTREDVPYPVTALDPPTIVAIAGGLEPRLHGEQMPHGDPGLRKTSIITKTI